MAETTAATGETPTADPRFMEWLRLHKRRNPHALFRAYESDGLDVAYRGWFRRFKTEGITLREATLLSEMLQADHPKGGLLPEQHLPRMLDFLPAVRTERAAATEAARREEDRQRRAEAERVDREQRDTWQALPESIRAGYLGEVRRAYPGLSARFPAFAERLALNLFAQEEAGDLEGAEQTREAFRAVEASPAPEPAPRRPIDDRPEPTRDGVRRALDSRHRQFEALALAAS